jgi:hypothetical protein
MEGCEQKAFTTEDTRGTGLRAGLTEKAFDREGRKEQPQRTRRKADWESLSLLVIKDPIAALKCCATQVKSVGGSARIPIQAPKNAA